MRITLGMLASNILRDISRADQRRLLANERLSSGLKLNRPSDNPVGITSSLSFRTALKEIEQYLGNISESIQWLNVTDSALNNAGEALHRVRELAVQAANSDLPKESLQALAEEMRQLREEIVSVGNTMYADRYIFGGHQTLTPPLSLDATGNWIYNGDAGQIEREIGAGVRLAINVVGRDVFIPAIEAISQLITDIEAGDTQAVGGRDLTNLDSALDNLLTYRAQVGAKTNRLELAQNRLMTLQTDVTRLKSDLEEADLAEVAVQLTTYENAYRMALSAAGKIIQPTLLDFLR